MAKTLHRRQPLVDRLEKHPELNDHGFAMVICKIYIDTYHGIGYTNTEITRMIGTFSVADISHGTAARKLQKANELEVFVTDRDFSDGRKQRYYLHPEMIKICSHAFGGMIEDAFALKEQRVTPPGQFDGQLERVESQQTRAILERLDRMEAEQLDRMEAERLNRMESRGAGPKRKKAR